MKMNTILLNKMLCYTTMVVNLCAPRMCSPCFTFVPMRELVLNYARSSGMHPSRKVQPHCRQLIVSRTCLYNVTYYILVQIFLNFSPQTLNVSNGVMEFFVIEIFIFIIIIKIKVWAFYPILFSVK
jgi:hypothetical protein